MNANAHDAALKAFAYTALEKVAKERKDGARDDAKAALIQFRAETKAKSIDIELPDGTVVASASLSAAKDGFTVTDEDAFFQWVLANFQHALKVDYGFKKAFLDRLEVIDADIHGVPTVVDPITGQVVDFVAYVKAKDAEPSLRISPSRAGEGGHALFWQAFAAGELTELDLMATPELPAGGGE